jgi:uncharacterized membrane protein
MGWVRNPEVRSINLNLIINDFPLTWERIVDAYGQIFLCPESHSGKSAGLIIWISWGIVLLIPTTFSVMAMMVPVAFATGYFWAGDILYDFLGRSCTHIPSRTLWIWGYPYGLCIRCTAIYMTFTVIGFRLLLRKSRALRPPIALGLIVPMFIDVTLQLFGIWHGHNWVRGMTGAMFGFGSASLLWVSMMTIICRVSENRINFRQSPDTDQKEEV